MPKPSLNPDKAAQGGAGFQPGNYEIAGAKFQNQKRGESVQLCLVLDTRVLDKDGAEVRGADPYEIQFSFGDKSLEAFHPGRAKGPDDEPEDLGAGVDIEGNTVFCQSDEQFNKSCGAMVFLESLVRAGFPKPTLDRCWAPDLVGLKLAIDSKTAVDLNERFGLRLNTKPMKDRKTGEDIHPPYKFVSAWLNAKDGGKKSDAKTEEKTDTAAGPSTPEEIVPVVLASVAKARPGAKGKLKTVQALNGFFTSHYTQNKFDPKHLAASQKLLKDKEYLSEQVMELGGTVHEDGSIEFPEAE